MLSGIIAVACYRALTGPGLSLTAASRAIALLSSPAYCPQDLARRRKSRRSFRLPPARDIPSQTHENRWCMMCRC